MTAPLPPVGLRLARVERELLAESAKARTAAMVAAQKRHDGFVQRVLDDARDRAGLVAGAEYAFAFEADFSAITFTPTGQAKAPEAPPEAEAVLPVPPSLKGAAKARATALDDSFAPSPPPPGGPT